MFGDSIDATIKAGSVNVGTVEVLYRTYAHCIEGADERWHGQMEDFLD